MNRTHEVTLRRQAQGETLSISRRRQSLWRRLQDTAAQNTFALITALSCLLLVVIALVLIMRSWPLLGSHSWLELLRGLVWQPTRALFGFAPFLIGSLAVTALAIVLAVPPAILSGIYLAEYTTTRTRNVLKPILDLLVGIPSVVYGLWGVLFIVPLIRDHIAPWVNQTLAPRLPFFALNNPSGYSLLAGGIVLAIMIFPFIVAVTDEVMRSVPRAMREAVLALGATRWESTKCIVRHAASGGIFAAVVLGVSRAFGETLAVMMVIGNVVQIPRSLFDSAYPLPALIANNYGEMMSIPLYEAALMTAALLLLMIVFGFNLAARLIVNRMGKEYADNER